VPGEIEKCHDGIFQCAITEHSGGWSFAACCALALPLGSAPASPNWAVAATLALLGGFAAGLWWRNRLRAENRRLTAAAEEAAALMGIVAQPALALDRRRRITLANPAAQRLLDARLYSAGERQLAQLLPCPALEDWLERIARSRATTTDLLEIEIAGRGGERRWYRVAAQAWTAGSATGNVASTPADVRGLVVLFEDVSWQKTAQRRNAELVSGVSHEMKTPLAGIKAYVELLADGDAEDGATQDEFLGIINSQADRLLQLVENLVQMAEVETATAGVGRQRCSLAELLDEALARVEPMAAAKQIALARELEEAAVTVLADRRLLLQAAVQVLSNAVKYTPAGGRVVLRCHTEGERVRVEVEDNGVGLAPEDCQKVFEKFYRVPQFKGMATGTGLGLPMARHIVENLHGGTLTVESQPGEGSLFAVELALASNL